MATQGRRKNSTSSGSRRRKKNQNQKKWILYVGVLAMGAAAIVFYNQYIGSIPFPSATETLAGAKSKKPTQEAFVEPDYQFYTLLPQSTAPHAQSAHLETKKPATNTVASTPKSGNTATTTTTAKSTAPIVSAAPTPLPPKTGNHYRLQLAAFKQYKDADELKAKLILRGYPTTINSATVNGAIWYRLSIGPYDTVSQAKTTQAQLEQTHLVSHTQVISQ